MPEMQEITLQLSLVSHRTHCPCAYLSLCDFQLNLFIVDTRLRAFELPRPSSDLLTLIPLTSLEFFVPRDLQVSTPRNLNQNRRYEICRSESWKTGCGLRITVRKTDKEPLYRRCRLAVCTASALIIT